MTAQHSAAMATWYSPEPFVEAARKVLGRIDLDPASDETGNRIVRASRIITAEQDGLATPWTLPTGPRMTIWLNPPGPVRKKGEDSRAYPKLFWQRLLEYRARGYLEGAVVAAFSIEQLQTSQNWGGLPMTAFPICIPRKRVSWNPPDGQEANSPTHASAFVYVPGTVDQRRLFVETFLAFGAVV